MKPFLIFLSALPILAQTTLASSPCSQDSWFANPKRTTKEWAAQPLARIIFVGKLSSRKENLFPFANCAAKDRSKCAVDDNSEVSIEVSTVEKGAPLHFPIVNLKKSYCAPEPPKAIGEIYRFYAYPDDLKPNSANNKFSYLYNEPVSIKK